MPPIYFDHHATTPVDPRVVEAMLPYLTEHFGNAASKLHAFGMRAHSAVEHARGQVAALIGASPKEIVFTSGATESNNLALIGAAKGQAGKGKHIVTTAIEHKAVLEAAEHLVELGWELTVVDPGPDGRVKVEDVRAALRADTTVVSVMYANNEIGVVQPIAELGALCRERGLVFHTDAAQAVGRIPIDVADLKVDLLSLTAHKMYGPKGIGALYVRRGRPRFRVTRLLHGGNQERGLRPGTLAVPGIVALGKAAELSVERLAGDEIPRLRALRDRLLEGLLELGGVQVNGDLEHRLANNLNVSIQGVSAQALLMSVRTVALSSGSACSTGNAKPSHVLKALGMDDERAFSSLRFGLGASNTAEEVEQVLVLLRDQVTELRSLGADGVLRAS